MDTCGCRYEPIIDPMGHCVGGNIIYCSKHAAAPEMCAVLTKISKWLQIDQGSSKNLTYKPFWVDEMIAVMQKMIGDENAS